MRLPYANLRVEHWNPGASLPLTLPIRVICNTSDEQIYTNIYTNSHAQRDWVKEEPAHGQVAILCGSGPSLKDCLKDIRALQQEGGKVFALNGAAQFLSDHLIYPDYQVILDARAETAQLLGPAKEHLFASQVSPELFAMMPKAKLWQLQVAGIDHILPDYEDAYVLIGGAASVGNTATCLAYAMGYRNLQIFGYDSSHRAGKGHAFHQKMNDGDPCALVKFAGKEYQSSLTMRLQAEKFQDTARELIDLGCNVEVHGDGLLPAIFNAKDSSVELERAKYEAMWAIPAYREHSPGEQLVVTAVEWMEMQEGSLIDFGIGSGKAANAFQSLGFGVSGVDIAQNCLNEGINIPVVQACLWQLPDLKADYGYCTDVMEHIPPQYIDDVLHGIMRCVPQAFFNICLVDDQLGSMIGERLHLSIYPMRWWAKKFDKLGYRVVRSQQNDYDALFHVARSLT